MNAEARALARRLFVSCWVVYSLHWAPYIVREHLAALTLAETGSFNVERFKGWSEAIVVSPAGGAYINNNPGASIVGALPLVAAAPVLAWVRAWNAAQPAPVPGPRFDSEFYRRAIDARLEWFFLLVGFLTVAGVMAPASALAVAALGWALRIGGVPRAQSAVAALAYGLLTPVFFRTDYLNHNLLVAHAALFGFLLLWDPRRAQISRGRAAAVGLLGGFAVLCDYSGLLVLAGLGVYLCVKTAPTRMWPGAGRAVAFAAGAGPMLAILAAYQYAVFGHSLLPAQHYLPAADITAQGYQGIDWPSLDLLVANFFDPRFGLFAFCPLLAVGLLAPFVRSGPFVLGRTETTLTLGFFAAFVLFCAANQYSALQWNTGFRYLVPVVPGLFVLTMQVVQTWPRRVAAVVLGASLLQGWLTAAAHMAAPWGGSIRTALELSWLGRMADLGLIDEALVPSIVLLVAVAAGMGWVWRREVRCAF